MTKTLKISKKTHQKLKIYCAKNNFQINKWVDECILNSIKIERILKNVSKINNDKIYREGNQNSS